MARSANVRIVTAPPDNDKRQRRLGSGLTPQVITAVMRQADNGYMDQWADLLDEVRQADPHLHGELYKREWQVAGAPYEIRPSGKTAKAKAAAAYCAELVEGLRVPAGSLAVSFRGLLAHLLGAEYHGRAAAEVLWERGAQGLRPVQVEWIHARRLAYADRSWKLHLWDASGIDSAFNRFPGVATDDPAVFPPGKLVVHTPRVYGTYPTREGLGRCVVWFAAFKRWSIRDWMAFGEWAGRGLRVGKYATGRDPKNPAQANDEDKQALEDALNAMSSSVSTVIPDVTDLAVIPAPPNSELHERLMVACNNEISKAVLGGTLSSDPGERGARSLGEVQERVRLMIATGSAGAVAETIRRDLFAPAVAERFGDRCPVPTLALQTEPGESTDAFVGRVEKMASAGLEVGVGFVRDTLGWPDPEPGEDVLGGKAAPPSSLDPNAPPAAPPKPGKKPAKEAA